MFLSTNKYYQQYFHFMVAANRMPWTGTAKISKREKKIAYPNLWQKMLSFPHYRRCLTRYLLPPKRRQCGISALYVQFAGYREICNFFFFLFQLTYEKEISIVSCCCCIMSSNVSLPERRLQGQGCWSLFSSWQVTGLWGNSHK